MNIIRKQLVADMDAANEIAEARRQEYCASGFDGRHDCRVAIEKALASRARAADALAAYDAE